MRFAAAIAAVLAHIAAPAAADDAAPCSPSLGVQTHFAQGWPLHEIGMVRIAGARLVRDGVSWPQTETSPGKYRVPQRTAAFLKSAAQRGYKVNLVFAGQNILYDEGNTPYTDEGRRAFANYVNAVLDQYGDYIASIEIGNEFNGAFVTGPAKQERPRHYAALLREVYATVKPNHPDIVILGGAAHSIPLGWYRDMLDLGAGAYMDGVVVHPYREHPENAAEEIRALQSLLQEQGAPKPVFVTEFGSEFDDPKEAPDFLLKMATLMSEAGVCGATWFILRDERWYKNMGLFDKAGHEKPALRAFQAVATAIEANGRAVKLSSDPLAQVYRFGNRGPIVAWGAGYEISVSGQSTVRRADGETIAAPARLEDRPVVITGGEVELGPSNTVADTLYQYATEQWTYLARSKKQGERALSRRDWVWTSYLGDPAFPGLAVSLGGVTPSGRGEAAAEIVERFAIPSDGVYEIAAQWSKRKNEGDGVLIGVTHNDETFLSERLTETVAFAPPPLRLEARAGDHIDFTIHPGGDGRGDATRRRFVIRRLD